MSEEPPSIVSAPGFEAGDFAGPPELAQHILVDVNILEECWLERLPWLETLAREAARDACLAGGKPLVPAGATAEISLTFADDDFMRQLNAGHRGMDKPTNVLSFPCFSPGAAVRDAAPLPARENESAVATPELLLGDVVLALETITREAEDQGKRLGDHVAHLVVHGVLHLLGFDHDADDEAVRMERLETGILANLGIGDPYSAGAAEGGVR